ncbi:MAG TPA: hypothetical protein VHC95_07025 [Opitutales bacterium]|nr:hypothetical protein [Opitutales bacterium]
MEIPLYFCRIVFGDTKREIAQHEDKKRLLDTAERWQKRAEDASAALSRCEGNLQQAQLEYQKLEARRDADSLYRASLDRPYAEQRTWRQIRLVFSGLRPDNAILGACVAIVDDRLKEARAIAERPGLPANDREHAAGGASWLANLRKVLLDALAEARGDETTNPQGFAGSATNAQGSLGTPTQP